MPTRTDEMVARLRNLQASTPDIEAAADPVRTARAIRSAPSCLGGAEGRFVAAEGDFRWLALVATRRVVFWGFFDIFSVPDRAAITGLGSSRKRPK